MRYKGFTLVEILIVVIILGILAAIVVPQFTEASDDAKLSNLTTNLQSVRAQLELYRLQHNGGYPSSLVTQLTTGTKADGTAGSDFGPYLQQVPANPYISDAVKTLLVDGAVGSGWKYTAASGEFLANDGSDDFTKW